MTGEASGVSCKSEWAWGMGGSDWPNSPGRRGGWTALLQAGAGPAWPGRRDAPAAGYAGSYGRGARYDYSNDCRTASRARAAGQAPGARAAGRRQVGAPAGMVQRARASGAATLPVRSVTRQGSLDATSRELSPEFQAANGRRPAGPHHQAVHDHVQAPAAAAD